jgi:hypothetical protein
MADAILENKEVDVDMLSGPLEDHFKEPYSLKEYRSVGLDDTYVLHLAASSTRVRIYILI